MKYPLILTLATVLLTACNTTPASNPQPGNPQPGNPQPGNPQPGNPQPGNPQPGNPVVKHLNPSGEWKVQVDGIGDLTDSQNLVIKDPNNTGKWFWSPSGSGDLAGKNFDFEGTYTLNATAYPYTGTMTIFIPKLMTDTESSPKCLVTFNDTIKQYAAKMVITGQFTKENEYVEYVGIAKVQVCKDGQFGQGKVNKEITVIATKVK